MDESKNKDIFGTKYIHISNASLIMGLKSKTLENRILTGKLTGTKIGRSWYLTESNIKDYLNEMTKFGTATA